MADVDPELEALFDVGVNTASEIVHNDEVMEAISNACDWAAIALDKALSAELAGIACAGTIAGAIQGRLMRRLLEPNAPS